MKNLFEPASLLEIKSGIERSQPYSERQWGLMSSAQMLAHCLTWMEMAAELIRAHLQLSG